MCKRPSHPCGRKQLTPPLACSLQLEECIVDAESQAELSSCLEGPPTSTPYDSNPFEAIQAFFTRFTKSPIEVDAEECIVDAESLEEIEACKN